MNKILGVVVGGVVLVTATCTALGYSYYKSSEENVLRTSQELKVENLGKWYKLRKFGLDFMLPEEFEGEKFEDVTPDDLKDFMKVVAQIGYDDTICAEMGFITMPDVLDIKYTTEENGEEMWELLKSSLSRVVQETFNGLLVSVSYDKKGINYDLIGGPYEGQATFILQQYYEDKDTGAVLPVTEQIDIDVKAYVVAINGRPVMCWAGYRSGYVSSEEEDRDQRVKDILSSVIATGDVGGVDIGYTYKDVTTLLTNDPNDPLTVDDSVDPEGLDVKKSGYFPLSTMGKVLIYNGYFPKVEGGYEWVAPWMLLNEEMPNDDVTGEGSKVSEDSNGNGIPDDQEPKDVSEEEALNMYSRLKDFLILDDEVTLRVMRLMSAYERWVEVGRPVELPEEIAKKISDEAMGMPYANIEEESGEAGESGEVEGTGGAGVAGEAGGVVGAGESGEAGSSEGGRSNDGGASGSAEGEDNGEDNVEDNGGDSVGDNGEDSVGDNGGGSEGDSGGGNKEDSEEDVEWDEEDNDE